MKFLNNSKYIFVIVALLFFSCEDELQQSPITERESKNFYSSEDEIESAVFGVYAALQSRDLYGLYLPAIGEVSSDNTFEEVPANDGGVFGQLDEFTVIPNNGLIGGIWKQTYIAVQRANTVLNRIDAISFDSDATKQARTGEMKFIRALLYFNMVRIYGDVPLVVEETTNPNDFFGQGRTPRSEVYTQIEQDLKEAITALPSSTSEIGRPSEGAAQALLGKVYLTLGRFSDALTQLQSVVNSGNYELVSNVENIFGIENENNSEVLFAVQFASGLDGNSEGSNAFSQFSPSGTVSNAKGHSLPTLELYGLYADADLRKGVYLDLTGNGTPFTNKLTPNTSNASDGGSDWIVLRYSDIILMLAEAENESGSTSTAISLLNSIRNRAGLANTVATTQAEVRDAIELERRLELIGEGHRWFDLLRKGKAIETMNAWFADQGINRTVEDKDLLMPIPQSQIDTDPAIKQNPGY
ncbi:RagB/SusD family nutrient uptake outer membrane protein [Fulvivirgaceae bacterium BMA10]|uniref:RagB/SusD family nutrient uptake outer membrane protein n=1 Tax=Splendidivirga corallicola TaxID=3051826 RepID=A0ABT8KUE1_9BACT|nr:RagB/SusD family nutrient uptake outer membrane protein [Fulvivirgaceae bacterium BMA10]